MKSNFYQSLAVSYFHELRIWAKLVNCHDVNSDKVIFKIRLQNGFDLIVKACSLLPRCRRRSQPTIKAHSYCWHATFARQE